MNIAKNKFLFLCITLITLANTLECTVREFKGTDAQFDAILKEGKPVVVKCYQTWCSACKHYEDSFKSISNQFPHVTFLAVDCAKNPSIESRFGFHGYPTTIFFDSTGNKKNQRTNVLTAEELRKEVEKLQ